MYVNVMCNNPAVTDLTAILTTLDRYVLSDLSVCLIADGHHMRLDFVASTPYCESDCCALLKAATLKRESHSDVGEWFRIQEQMYETDGHQGFLDFLAALTPYLEEPLIIVKSVYDELSRLTLMRKFLSLRPTVRA